MNDLKAGVGGESVPHLHRSVPEGVERRRIPQVVPAAEIVGLLVGHPSFF